MLAFLSTLTLLSGSVLQSTRDLETHGIPCHAASYGVNSNSGDSGGSTIIQCIPYASSYSNRPSS